MVTRPSNSLNQNGATDFLPILGIDHVELWVGNAFQAAHFYQTVFGFDVIAYAGPETGVRDRASYALRQGEVTLVVTAGLGPDSPIVQHTALHGDGVRDVALGVPDVDSAFAETTRRGARPVVEPTTVEGQKGAIRRAAIAIYGETIHSFVDRSNYTGAFFPGYHRVSDRRGAPTGVDTLDHLVGNVELGQMDRWVAFYRDVMGFSQLVHFSDEAIKTEYSALMSKVMQNGTGRVKFPINEPAIGKKKSQIQEFLDFYQTPGVQHLALRTDDIVQTVRQLRSRGLQFLRVPAAYYAGLHGRVGAIQENFDVIQELGILVDRDDEGYLLQIFSKPVQDRPTAFFEIIQRRGARGFGEGNFKALFEAIELEQAKRGNL
ncbi:MAG TPA: 4-hydroxyphenylpyruvate dioxygenase [Chloroflexota bacterium]|nr:4-hydroxyphenylpyruvate dioxygenase [Chloroflexota bacterium]